MPPAKRAPAKCNLMCCTTPPAAVAKIREDIKGWVAGEFAIRMNRGPACTCTLAAAKEPCILHGTPSGSDSGASR